MPDTLILKFDPNTIEHLGISLYSKLPNVLSELVSNSWDADSEYVSIDFIDKDGSKEIIFNDDGEGMSYEELQDKYLVIGRNRRRNSTCDTSAKGRKVIGKKGLGKLSVFGICNIIEVISVKEGIKNHFKMDLSEIRQSKTHSYNPEIIVHNSPTDEMSGTTLHLKEIRRKSPYNLENIALSLSKKFLIFDEMSTDLYFNGVNTISVTNDLKFEGLNIQFEWKFPDSKYDSDYEYYDRIRGTIFTLETPVKDTEMRGIYLTSRGKIVNTADFYGARDNDQFHSYVTGYLEVDFIDDFDEDVISTDRQSLNWEHESTKKLQEYLQKIIRRVGTEWKNKRAQIKKDSIVEEKNINIDEWQEQLPSYERELSIRIINPILLNSNIDVAESSEIIENVIDKFDNQTFKEYASQIADISEPEDIPKFLKLMDDWKTIESKEIRGLANARVEVIKQFEAYLNEDANEVPTLHNFFKKFSWLLDPRILEFKDEVRYSELLKESFPEAELEEPNKRIDFLCSNALGDILYVIEIKRSNYAIDLKALDQAYEYGAFLTERYASETGFSKVVCFVVGGEKSRNGVFRKRENTYRMSGEVFVKTYTELLEQSKEYHKEFIDAYNQYNRI
ncbi:ATP-binding protein [Methanolobus bombayensis]|uniref:ATP-binding protein n=1 Tax=Methanolobus bombayensis TaxID=38023 RepID=UPI001AE62131|nr:ATP-binding protein [Methanolobus bombayensis]MBP1910327.1 hypothetical protein [Methanolobus bombayensis]